ncbi:host cell division inhibitor Icd-like protein [Escherichia coli]|nr:host cell division inhibitor Icd-like protein [Escherichia coli]
MNFEVVENLSSPNPASAKSRQQLAHDYMRHIVSHFAAERMKHVKQYREEVLSNYRAGGPVWREYPHDAGMAGKTKATTKGSPVEIKEIKRTVNDAISPAFSAITAMNTSDHLSKKAAYTEAIPYKTGIGRRNPFNQYKATQARPASFFVSYHRATIPSGKDRTVSMVALVGQPKGWPVSLYAGIPTPASVTALYERRNSSGDSLKQYKEAFHMAVSARPYFVWRFIAFGVSGPQIIHVTAWTEREARNRCPSGCVAVFAARIRQEASHG